MEIFQSVAHNPSELLQNLGIISSLLFTAYATLREEHARRIGNYIAIKEQHAEIWRQVYDRPALSRVLRRDSENAGSPISIEEEVFVKSLILHLGTVHRASKAGMFAKIEGLEKDIAGFFALPIPRAIWEKFKPLQDKEFVKFVESSMAA